MMGKINFYFWASIYKVIYELAYFIFISPVYTYFGLIWDPSLVYFFISYILFFSLLIILPKGQSRPSHQLINLMFFITIVPLLSFFWQASQSIYYISYVSLCFLILSVLLRLSKPLKIKFIRPNIIKRLNPIKWVNIIFFISLILLIIFSVIYGSIDTRAFNFSNVYEIREDANYNGIWSYIIEWLGKLLIPFCIVMYLIDRKKKLLLLSSLMQIYLYLCTGQKTILFSVLFLVFFTIILKKGKFLLSLPIFYTIAIIGSCFLYSITNNLFSIGIMPFRYLNIPAYLNFVHYDFFAKNTKLYFSEGIIGKLLGLEYKYNIPSTYLVSPIPEMNANTGFLANGYDNGGFLIMLFFTLLLGFILLFVDSVSRNSKDRYRYTALMLYTITILNDGALLTTLLTSGSGILLVFLYILASEENRNLYNYKNQDKSIFIKNN